MKIYIDIDGVLLKKNLIIPDYAEEFISFLTINFDCYWLTTHCRGGNNAAIDYLSKYYDEETMEHLAIIKKTDWTSLKTEAIDLRSAFIWLDDYPFESEKRVLKAHHQNNALIIVDLNRKNELIRIQEKIKTIARSA